MPSYYFDPMVSYTMLIGGGNYTNFNITLSDPNGATPYMSLSFSSGFPSQLDGQVSGTTPYDYSVVMHSNDMTLRQQVEYIFGLQGQKEFYIYVDNSGYGGNGPYSFPVQYFYIATLAAQTIVSARPVLPPNEMIRSEGTRQAVELLRKAHSRQLL